MKYLDEEDSSYKIDSLVERRWVSLSVLPQQENKLQTFMPHKKINIFMTSIKLNHLF